MKLCKTLLVFIAITSAKKFIIDFFQTATSFVSDGVVNVRGLPVLQLVQLELLIIFLYCHGYVEISVHFMFLQTIVQTAGSSLYHKSYQSLIVSESSRHSVSSKWVCTYFKSTIVLLSEYSTFRYDIVLNNMLLLSYNIVVKLEQFYSYISQPVTQSRRRSLCNMCKCHKHMVLTYRI